MNYEPRYYGTPRLSVEQLADLALLSLHQLGATESYYKRDTNRIFEKCVELARDGGAVLSKAGHYVVIRELLNRMHGLGLVDKPYGGSKKQASLWYLKTLEWDRENPFSGAPKSDPIPYTMGTPGIKSRYDGEEVDSVPLSKYQTLQEKYDKVSAGLTVLEESVKTCVEANKQVQAENANLKEQLTEASRWAKVIKIERPDGTKLTLKDTVLPKYFDDLLALCNMRMNVLLVGPAGCGKTHAAELAATALGLRFEAVSCTAGMSEVHLTGRVRPKLTGDDLFQTTGFLDTYEGGGVFLFDEFDAADPNLLLVVNTALANGYCNVPNRDGNTRAKRHKDFVAVATANTFGRGATRMYSGRNQIDEATLDRFRIGLIECDYDQLIEEALCPDEELRTWCWSVRKAIEAAQLRRIMSTRFMQQAYQMKAGAGWELKKIQDKFFSGWGADERNKVETKRWGDKVAIESKKPFSY